MTAEPRVPAHASDEARHRTILRAAIISTCLSGAAALIYEVTWTRELSLVFGSTVYAVSMMLTAFMSGLSLGSYLGGRHADKPGVNLIRSLAVVELAIGAFGVLSIPEIRLLPGLYYGINDAVSSSGPVFYGLQMVLSFCIMLVPTTLMGATFPIVSKIVVRTRSGLGRAVGGAYSANTLGSIIGSLSAGFLLIPVVGVRGAIIAAAAVNITAAAVLLALTGAPRWRRMISSGVVVLMVAASLGVLVPDPAFTLGFAIMNRYPTLSDYQVAEDDVRVLYSKENEYSKVTVVEYSDGARQLFNGGSVEGGTDDFDIATTGALAALPLAFVRKPEDALVIGLGTGFTSAAMLDSEIRRLDTVEINPAVRFAARYFVGTELERDPRWHLVVDDARYYVETTDQRYDVISSEPSWPLNEAVGHLFTREFYEASAEALNEDGVFCQWLPGYLLTRDDFMMMYRTFHEVYPDAQAYTLVVDGAVSNDMFLVGVKPGGDPVSAEAALEQVNGGLVVSSGASVKMVPMDSPETLAQALNDPRVPVNTDDLPLLEFHVVENLANQIAALR